MVHGKYGIKHFIVGTGKEIVCGIRSECLDAGSLEFTDSRLYDFRLLASLCILLPYNWIEGQNSDAGIGYAEVALERMLHSSSTFCDELLVYLTRYVCQRRVDSGKCYTQFLVDEHLGRSTAQ